MPGKLPARPNLEHLRAQAKMLLTKLREGDADAIKTLIQYLPEATELTARQVQERGFRLADAQAAIARKSGFGAWPGLARHVERLRSMEGKWAFHCLEMDGQSVPLAMLTQSFLLIDGDRFRMESPEATYEGIFGVDVEKTPHEININFVDGQEAGNQSEGIFELDGDRLRICLGLVGSTRPKSFATAKGSGHALEDLVRVESARPSGVDGGTAPAVRPGTEAEPCGNESDFNGPLTSTMQRLQGEWQPLELINSGTPLQAAYLAYGSRIQEGSESKVVFGGQTMLHAKVRFNEMSSPIEVDYWNLSGKSKGSISRGIFQWQGDEEALFCIGSPGGPRPDDFTCSKGSGRMLSRWRLRR